MLCMYVYYDTTSDTLVFLYIVPGKKKKKKKNSQKIKRGREGALARALNISHKTKGCDIWPPLKSQFRKAVVGWEHCVIFILVT